jgi:hypothetical protein
VTYLHDEVDGATQQTSPPASAGAMMRAGALGPRTGAATRVIVAPRLTEARRLRKTGSMESEDIRRWQKHRHETIRAAPMPPTALRSSPEAHPPLLAPSQFKWYSLLTDTN